VVATRYYSPEDEDSQQKYKMIEERVNKSIVMEYMQGDNKVGSCSKPRLGATRALIE
jgi:hypothetical protein